MKYLLVALVLALVSCGSSSKPPQIIVDMQESVKEHDHPDTDKEIEELKTSIESLKAELEKLKANSLTQQQEVAKLKAELAAQSDRQDENQLDSEEYTKILELLKQSPYIEIK